MFLFRNPFERTELSRSEKLDSCINEALFLMLVIMSEFLSDELFAESIFLTIVAMAGAALNDTLLYILGRTRKILRVRRHLTGGKVSCFFSAFIKTTYAIKWLFMSFLIVYVCIEGLGSLSYVLAVLAILALEAIDISLIALRVAGLLDSIEFEILDSLG